MLIVCVTFEVIEGNMGDFLPAVKSQAKNSLSKEPGCHRFDVCTSPEQPNKVFLYEHYANHAAFSVHMMTEHYKAFDAAVAPLIANKDVHLWTELYTGR